MNLNPGDQTPMMPSPEGRRESTRSRQKRSRLTLYYGFVSVFFGLAVLVAFGSGSPAMGFLWAILLVFFLLLPKLVRRGCQSVADHLVNRAPQSSSSGPQYGSIPQQAIWSPGTRYDPGVHGYQPGLRPGDTMRPTAAQDEARNIYGTIPT